MTNGIPREIRRWICSGERFIADWLTGRRSRLVRPNWPRSGSIFPVQLTLNQPIPETEYVQAKRCNLELARRLVDNLPVPPSGIFSFWQVIGKPTPQRGFERGRSLLGGELRPDSGGELCQLSGLIYHLSLLAGLQVLERHPHSVDIYDDTTRYAPLGADATVAYGFKDLRVVNTLSAPVCFRITLAPDVINCAFCSPAPVQNCRVEFLRRDAQDGIKTVVTRRYAPGQNEGEVLNISHYRALRPHQQP